MRTPSSRRVPVLAARVFPAAALLTLLLSSAASAQAGKQLASTGALTPELEQARAALDKYQDPIAAVHDGYFSTVGCVEYTRGGDEGSMHYAPGGMGVHFLNLQLIGQRLDPAKPQILIYEPVGGKLRLAAAEWFVPGGGGGRGASGDLWPAAPGPDGGSPSAPAGRAPPLRPARVAVEEQPGRGVLAHEPGGQVPQGQLLVQREGAEDGGRHGALRPARTTGHHGPHECG
jgi:hypothetical protein